MPSRHLDDTLIALADPTRRAILEALSRGESRVTDVAMPFAMSLNAVSKHIRMLERARLVRRRIQGRDHFLSLNPLPLDQVGEWVEMQRTVWRARLRMLDALLQKEDRERRHRPAHKRDKK